MHFTKLEGKALRQTGGRCLECEGVKSRTSPRQTGVKLRHIGVGIRHIGVEIRNIEVDLLHIRVELSHTVLE